MNGFNWKDSAVACFTWKAEGTLEPCLALPPGSRYIYQLELSEEGYLHYQGYVKFPKVMTKKQLKSICSIARWSNRRASHNANIRYCSKEDTRMAPTVNNGMELTASETANQGSGARTDLEVARSVILGKRKWSEVIMDPDIAPVVSKCMPYCAAVFANRPVPPLALDLYPWQESLLSVLLGPVDDRAIYWYWESRGGVGKSKFATYLQRNHGALVLESGKSGDIAMCFDNHEIVCFDLARTTQEHCNYGIMESLKNGRIFSPKYYSCVKPYPIPHVVVFANYPPKQGSFSEDRIKITELGDRSRLCIRPVGPTCPGAPFISRSRRYTCDYECDLNCSVSTQIIEVK